MTCDKRWVDHVTTWLVYYLYTATQPNLYYACFSDFSEIYRGLIRHSIHDNSMSVISMHDPKNISTSQHKYMEDVQCWRTLVKKKEFFLEQEKFAGVATSATRELSLRSFSGYVFGIRNRAPHNSVVPQCHTSYAEWSHSFAWPLDYWDARLEERVPQCVRHCKRCRTTGSQGKVRVRASISLLYRLYACCRLWPCDPVPYAVTPVSIIIIIIIYLLKDDTIKPARITTSRTTRRYNTHLQNAPKYTITHVHFTKCLYNIYNRLQYSAIYN